MELIIHKVHLPMRQWIKTAHEDIRFRDTIIIELRDAGYTFWSEAPGFKRRGICLRLTINYGSVLINWVWGF